MPPADEYTNTLQTDPGLLDGVIVVDFSVDVGGLYCTKLLADLGATVIQIEPPEGHPLRQDEPFFGGEPHVEKSARFAYYAANKKSIVLDLNQQSDRQQALDLVKNSDIVVETFSPGYLEEIGLGYEALKAVNNSLILTSVTRFGQTGPYRHWQGEEIIDWALGGYMYFNGHPDREPLMIPGNQAQLQAGTQAAIATLTALWHSQNTGVSQHIDVSAMEAMVSAHSWTSGAWTHEGLVLKRTEPDCIPCKDGWVFFMTYRWDLNLFLMIERHELMDDPRFADRQSWIDNRDELREILTKWCMLHTKEEIFRLGQELLIAVTPVNTAEDLANSPQLESRNWFQEVNHPIAGNLSLPGGPFKFNNSPIAPNLPAPTLDQHANYYPEARKREASKSTQQFDPELPLKGIRVLELTANWAGPLAGRHLSDLGAGVIKIESPDRPMTRGGHYAGGQPLKYHYNRSAYFNKLNRNKYAATLNLAHPKGRETFLKLVKISDIVIENFSPRVMRNFNLEYPVLREVNPKIIMASISGFGHTGPERDYVAYGANIEASSGLAAQMGYSDDSTPYRSTLFYADPVTGGHTAVAILAALFKRKSTGIGQHIDLSLQENGIAFFSEAVLEYLATGDNPKRLGNRHRQFAPQGCYPSIGDDSWLVISIRSDDEWQRLCDVLGDSDLAHNPKFANAEDRQLHHDEIDEIISNWSSNYDHNEATRILQSAGVAAAPVLANWELVSNPHLHERGFYISIPHKEMGVFPYPGMPWKLSETPGKVRMGSPDFGEHNSMVFEELLNLSQQEIEELYSERIIADSPPDDMPGPIRLR